MAGDKWQTPLVDVADPYKLKKFAEETAEVKFAENVFGIAEHENFLESYLDLLRELGEWDKFEEGKKTAARLLAQRDGALVSVSDNAQLFDEAAKKCKMLNNTVKEAKKKSVWGKCQTHLQNWKAAFSEDGEMLAAAIRVDQALYKNKGPMSVGVAVTQVRRRGGEWPEGLEGVVRWYLETVRVKYREDFELKREEEPCGKCGAMKGKDEECPKCAELARALKAAQEAEQKGEWKTAQQKAKEVLAGWKGHPEADRIKTAADAALKKIEEDKKKVENTEGQIRKALAKAPPDTKGARTVLDEARGLHGFDADKWENAIREKEDEQERRDREEAEKRERKKALVCFNNALANEEFAEAEEMIPRLVRLKAGKEKEFRDQIDAARGKKEKRLATVCIKALDEATKALSGAAENADLEGGEEGLKKAQDAFENLQQEFPKSAEMKLFREKIKEIEQRLEVVQDATAERSLKAAEWVKAVIPAGSTSVTVEWKGEAKRWRVFREEGGRKIPVKDNTVDTKWTDADAKPGVKYRYGVAPMIQKAKGWAANELPEKMKWSGEVWCLLPTTNVHGAGLGISGGESAVSLEWELPAIPNGTVVALEVAREPAFRSGKPVTLSEVVRKWSDKEVQVGGAYHYTITLTDGKRRTLGARSGCVEVKKAERPPAVEELMVQRRTAAEFVATWKWRGSATKAEWRVEPSGARDEVAREAGAETGRAVVYGTRGVRSTIHVTSLCSIGPVNLKGEAASKDFGEPEVVECRLLQTGGWRKREWVLHAACSGGGMLPPLSVRLGKDREPFSARDGEDLGRPTSVNGKPGEGVLLIPKGRTGYIHVFLDASESPADWRVKQPQENRIK